MLVDERSEQYGRKKSSHFTLCALLSSFNLSWDLFWNFSWIDGLVDLSSTGWKSLKSLSTLPETNSLPLKIGHPKRKGSSSNHPFSGANCYFWGGEFPTYFVHPYFSVSLIPQRLMTQPCTRWAPAISGRISMGRCRSFLLTPFIAGFPRPIS